MSDIARLTDRASWPQLATVLDGWMRDRRWFQGKARTVTGVVVDDVAFLPGTVPVADVFVQVDYRRGAPERYQVPLVTGEGVGTVADVPLGDALAVPGGARTIAAHALDAAAAETVGGCTVQGAPVGNPTVLPEGAKPLGVEQSNTSVVFGDALLLKVFRKLESGVNPEVELTRALTEEGFAHVPPQAGALLLDGSRGPCALAVLSAFLSGAQDAWTVACAEASAARRGVAPPPLEGRSEALGAVVGRLHQALARRFGGREATRADVEAWVGDMHTQLDAVLATLAERGSEAAAVLPGLADGIRRRLDQLRQLDDAGAVIRTHGDLHLGQVLLHATHGWQILDFEGEPARPLAERRLPHSPVRDVAGMLRSFDYAAAHGSEGDAAPPDEVASWRDAGRSTFLAAYLRVAGGSGLLPQHPDAQQALLAAFELDKAIYEVGYELANRPRWIHIPVGGILRLLDHEAVPSPLDRQGGAA